MLRILTCFFWIEDLLRKPQIPEWLFVIAEIQCSAVSNYTTINICGESYMTKQIRLALPKILQQKQNLS